mmetsp:Transcript_70583/g.159677  ORF Transcript_70583/g.159677 Transcript_70583/m.159677 type:complete len:454 (+) Transcript_70583:127-1488(+)
MASRDPIDCKGVLVNIRIRPASSRDSTVVTATADGVSVGNQRGLGGFASRVVQGSDQKAAHSALGGALLEHIWKGYACTLLAYGQTGSGKTYTMFGAPGSLTETALAEARTAGGAPAVPEEWGTFPRTVLELLASRPKLSTHSLHASAVEVYQDAAYDLLDDRKPLAVGSTTRRVGLKLGGGALQAIGKVVDGKGAAESKGADHHGVHPPGCRCGKCFVANKQALAARLAARDAGASKLPALPGKAASTAAKRGVSGGGCSFETRGETLWPLVEASDVARLARTVELTRQTVGHALNARSSRSHCLVTVHLTERPPAKGAARGKSGVARRSRLLFVDLAGSERIKKTGVEGSAKDQALAINGSLTALGKVIRALSTKAAHVPFRDSTLTYLLEPALSGQGKTLMIVNLSPTELSVSESISTLRFGSKVNKVELGKAKRQITAGSTANEKKATR